MFGRVDKANAMIRRAEKCGPVRHRGQDSRLALDTQFGFNVAVACHQANERFRFVGVQLIYDEDPAGLGIRFDYSFNMMSEILLCPCGTDRGDNDLARGYRKTGNQRLRAVADVLKFAQFHYAFDHWTRLVFALYGLDAGLFVGRDHVHPHPCQAERLLVEVADGLDLAIKRLWILSPLVVEPVAKPVRFEICLVLKNAPHCGEKSA